MQAARIHDATPGNIWRALIHLGPAKVLAAGAVPPTSRSNWHSLALVARQVKLARRVCVRARVMVRLRKFPARH